jgi:hypothetical protein
MVMLLFPKLNSDCGRNGALAAMQWLPQHQLQATCLLKKNVHVFHKFEGSYRRTNPATSRGFTA